VTVWGIVGSEAAKFTQATKPMAFARIRGLLRPGDKVVSDACPLGGIDAWAIQIAREMGLECWEHAPKTNDWDTGFKPRNILIAQDCTEAVCLTVKSLPSTYRGRTFPLCYHCGTTDHVKSGGCWTVKYARERLGKPGRIIVIGED